MKLADLPDEICGQRVRMWSDGTFSILRMRRDTIETLSHQYGTILQGKQTRFYCNRPSDGSIDLLNQVFGGECAIVGKGPSLGRLSSDHFREFNGPVICINHAILAVEPLGLPNQLFMMQQDTFPKGSCAPCLDSTILILDHNTVKFYAEQADDAIEFCFREIGMEKQTLTAGVAVRFAKYFGSTSFKMMCFDACVDGTLGYADITNIDPKVYGPPRRFLDHRAKIDAELEDTPTEWILP